MPDQSHHDADPDVRPDPQVGPYGPDGRAPAPRPDAVSVVEGEVVEGELLFAHLDHERPPGGGDRPEGVTAAAPELRHGDREPDGSQPPDGGDIDGGEPGDAAGGGDGTGDGVSGHPPPGDGSRSKGKGSFLRELPVLLVIAFILAFLLRTFVVQVFYIPSSSMEPTLQVNDRMVVEKITYLFRDPQRGDVVVFEGEQGPAPDPDANIAERTIRGFGQFVGLVPASARDFVKRVIGVPGDEILIEDGQVFVNGEPLDEPYARLDESDFGPITVPDDSLFFLGDNRANSSDSRRSLGYVPLEAVVGRSVLILWPFDHAGSLTGVEFPTVPDPGDTASDGPASDQVRDETPPDDTTSEDG